MTIEPGYPKPLVPPDVDLRDFGFMPLDVRTLLSSSLWIKAKRDPRVAHAAVSLWCECWHQIPAASLPDDDEVLGELARCDPKEWARVRDRALLHFVKCSDGRLYHRHVALKALEAWSSKQSQRARTKAATEARAKKQVARDECSNVDRDDQRDVARDVARDGQRHEERDEPRDEERHVHQGTGTGIGIEKEDPPASRVPPAAAVRRPAKRCPSDFEVTPDMVAWASTEAPGVNVDRETAKFRDYTFATARSDWPATWRNWLRKVAEKPAMNGSPGHRGPSFEGML